MHKKRPLGVPSSPTNNIHQLLFHDVAISETIHQNGKAVGQLQFDFSKSLSDKHSELLALCLGGIHSPNRNTVPSFQLHEGWVLSKWQLFFCNNKVCYVKKLGHALPIGVHGAIYLCQRHCRLSLDITGLAVHVEILSCEISGD